MTPNYSMQLTAQIKEKLQSDLTGVLKDFLPTEKILQYQSEHKNVKKRDRIYSDDITLLSMIVTAVQEDKSLQNSVNLFSEIHRQNALSILQRIDSEMKIEREKDNEFITKRGRPKKYNPRIAKSKLKSISTNTGSYTTARQRLDIGMVKMVYKESTNFEGIEINNKWKGMPVYITDGTYNQLQDTKELRDIYDVKSDSKQYHSSYPQGLLQVIIEQGSGAIKHFEFGSRHVSELELISKLLPQIPRGTLLLADDLYNCYAIFFLIKKFGLEIIVPGKRYRVCKVIKKISEGDEIVELKKNEHPNWLPKKAGLPNSIQMRRLTFEDPMKEGKEYVIFTSLLDPKISKIDIVTKYFTRWDIEICIREIKTLMDINVIRSKKPDLVIKELYVALIAYNLIRKLIANTTENSGFSPQKHIIQEFFEAGKTILMDKKGRVYSRWSTGRHASVATKNQKPCYSEQTGQTL